MSPLFSRGGDSSSEGGGGRISFEEFTDAVTSCGYSEPPQSTYQSFLNEARNFAIFDKQELAMILAHYIHDSRGFIVRREKVNLEKYPESYRDPECDAPHQLYYGRGFLKIRLCKNYRDISMDLFKDDRLVKKPEELILEDDTAMKVGFAFWKRNVQGYPGVDKGHFGATTNAINGASECNGENTQIARKRYEVYKKVRQAFKLSAPSPEAEGGCYEVNKFMNAASQSQLPKS